MKEDGFPYCIPHKRELSSTELALLDFLLPQIDDVTVSASALKVVARCGCGACPIVLFGLTLDDEPITCRDSEANMDWSGRAENGTLVGIGIWVKDGMPTELDIWSIDGGDVVDLPPTENISRF
jgi:hypothetical protein